MRSITYWNRLEVRPRSAILGPALSARIRDPLWMLTRQWQFGEFRGEDAAAPAYAQLSGSQGRFLAWQPHGQPAHPLRAEEPLEPRIEAEPFTPDLASRVEIGQLFEKLLGDAGVPELAPDFRGAYRIPALSEEEFAAAPDRETARFQQMMAGRALDGLALHQAAKNAGPDLPVEPVVDPPKQEAVRTALAKFNAWMAEVWGSFGLSDAPDWRPDRLEYDVSLIAAAPGGGAVAIEVQPGSSGDFAWQSMDVRPATATDVTVPDDAVKTFTRSVIPGRVQFRGMPNHRWWDFEQGQMDFGGITPDKRDLAKLVIMDFMLVQGNDWFLIPFVQDAGSLSRIDSLVVHDIFGGETQIQRADLHPGSSVPQRWTLFSTSIPTGGGGLADFFLLPSDAGSSAQQGMVIEEVRFLRDEMANMAWAVEHTTENGLGRPWPGHERDLALQALQGLPQPGTGASDDGGAPLRYLMQTRVPENWIPLLPVTINPQEGDIALERGSMLRDTPDAPPIPPAGRVLQPLSLEGAPYHIREEEVPRGGLIISRTICRTRGCDGSTHLWVARRKQIGRGEGSSGLRFDQAVSVPQGSDE